MKEIEAKASAKTLLQIYKDVFLLLDKIFGKQSEQQHIKSFRQQLLETGKLPERFGAILKEIVEAKGSGKKLSKHDIERIRKGAVELVSALIEYSQRKDIAALEREKFRLRYKERDTSKEADAFCRNKTLFVIFPEGNIKKITEEKIIDSTKEEFEAFITAPSKESTINTALLAQLKKLLGEFEIVF